MSFGAYTLRPCPHACGLTLGHVDYTRDPPPIPAPKKGYASLNHYCDDERSIRECPRCGGEL